MSEELDRLRAEKKALDSLMGRHLGSTPLAAIHADVANRIEKLESEAADPWREAKEKIQEWKRWDSKDLSCVCSYVRHLETERDRMAARVAELESLEVKP